MQRFQTIFLSLIWLIFLPLPASAADETDTSADESEMAPSELSPAEDNNIMLRQLSPIVGFHPLTVAGQEIPATFLEETFGEKRGAIVFLHDQGEELESVGVVTPLRHDLLQYGWSTLTVALDYPFTPNIILAITPEPGADSAEATEEDTSAAPETEAADKVKKDEPEPEPEAEAEASDDADKDKAAELPPISNQQRIEAALAFLTAKDIKRIIFLGHGEGGLEAITILHEVTTPIEALILVSTPALETDDEFKTFDFPILDIYGDNDLAGVSTAVHQRKLVMKRTGNISYTAREIIGANHVYYGLEPLLTSTVRGWLHARFVKQEESK